MIVWLILLKNKKRKLIGLKEFLKCCNLVGSMSAVLYSVLLANDLDIYFENVFIQIKLYRPIDVRRFKSAIPNLGVANKIFTVSNTS